jgi:hypothetical protein
MTGRKRSANRWLQRKQIRKQQVDWIRRCERHTQPEGVIEEIRAGRAQVVALKRPRDSLGVPLMRSDLC